MLKTLLVFFTVYGFFFVHTSTGLTLTKKEDGPPSQKNPERQTTAHEVIKNRKTEETLSRNHKYEEGTNDRQTPETFSPSFIFQKEQKPEKSSLTDNVKKEVVKLNLMERMKQEIVEEERKETLVAGVHLHEIKEDTSEEEKMPKAKQEIRKGHKEGNKLRATQGEDTKRSSFDESDFMTMQTITQLQNPPSSPPHFINLLPSPPGVSTGVPSHSNIKRRPLEVKSQLNNRAEPARQLNDEARKGELISKLQEAKSKPPEVRFLFRDLETNPPQKSNQNIINMAKMAIPTEEPNTRQTQAEPRSVQQMENDTISSTKQNKTSPQPQVTPTSAKPQLTAATTPSSKPRQTNKSSKNRRIRKEKKQRKDNKTQKPPKGKKKNTPLMYFPFFKDDYCPPECACYGRVVQCSDKGVHQFPYGIPYNSRYILLMNNHITSIQLDLLSEYDSMEFLTLSNNELTDGSIEGAFEGVPALKRLYLDGNLLQSVPIDLPVSLEELRLDSNHLQVMSEAAWTRCPGLLVLSLSNNSFDSESLPSDVLSSLCKLRTLNLNYNRLVSVPLGLPLTIRELYLKGNHIKQFNGGAFNGTSELVLLDLSANRLTNKGLLADALLNATHMESLNLEGNKLKQVPRQLPPSLKALNLEGNLISSITKAAFSTMKNLEHLGLARNKIFKVAPGAFKTLPILHQLDLCHNTLHQVPRQLPQGLHTVALTHNRIQSVPRDAFCWGDRSLSGLVQVQLEHNLIDLGKLDGVAFRCLRGFQVVHFY